MKKKNVRKLGWCMVIVSLVMCLWFIKDSLVIAEGSDVTIDTSDPSSRQSYYNDTSVTKVSVSGSGELIDGALAGCRNLSELDLSGFTGTIGSNVFQECTNLSSVTFDSSSSYKYTPGIGITYTDSSTGKTDLIYSNEKMSNNGVIEIRGVDNIKAGALCDQAGDITIFTVDDNITIGANNFGSINKVITNSATSYLHTYYGAPESGVVVEIYSPGTPVPVPPTGSSPDNPPVINPTPSNPGGGTSGGGSSSGGSSSSDGGSSSGGYYGGYVGGSSVNTPTASYNYKPYRDGHIKQNSDGTTGPLESHVFGDWSVVRNSMKGSVAGNVSRLNDVTFWPSGSTEVSVVSTSKSNVDEAMKAASALLANKTGSFSVEKVFDVSGPVEFPIDITFHVATTKANSNVAVLHKRHDGNWESLPVKGITDGEVTATFYSFSPVAIVIYATVNNSSDTVMTRKCALCGYEEISTTKQTSYNVGAGGVVSQDHVKDDTPKTADGDLDPRFFLSLALCLGGIGVIIYGRQRKYEIIAKSR